MTKNGRKLRSERDQHHRLDPLSSDEGDCLREYRTAITRVVPRIISSLSLTGAFLCKYRHSHLEMAYILARNACLDLVGNRLQRAEAVIYNKGVFLHESK